VSKPGVGRKCKAELLRQSAWRSVNSENRLRFLAGVCISRGVKGMGHVIARVLGRIDINSTDLPRCYSNQYWSKFPSAE
jgi:hypothetical protein